MPMYILEKPIRIVNNTAKHFIRFARLKYSLAFRNSTVIMLNVDDVCPDGNEFGSADVVKTCTFSKTKDGLGDEKPNFRVAAIMADKINEQIHNLTKG